MAGSSNKWYNTIGDIGSALSPIMSVINPVLGLGTSIFGALLGSNKQDELNEEQIKLQRETNAQNYQMWQEQQQHNIDLYNMQSEDAWNMARYNNSYNSLMYERQKRDNLEFWHRQNEYNSPVAQKQRLLDAGINPYLAMSGSAGTAAGAISGATPQGAAPLSPPSANSSSPIPAQAPNPSAFTNYARVGLEAGESVGKIINGIFDTLEKTQRIKGMKIDNKYKDAINKQNLEFVNQQSRNLALASTLQERTLELQVSSLQEQVESQRKDNLMKGLQIEYQQTINKYCDERQQIELATMVRNYTLLGIQGELTAQQVKTEIAKQVQAYASANESNSRRENVEQDTKYKKQEYNNFVAISEALVNSQIAEFELNGMLDQSGIDYLNSSGYFKRMNGLHHVRNKTGWQRPKAKFKFSILGNGIEYGN